MKWEFLAQSKRQYVIDQSIKLAIVLAKLPFFIAVIGSYHRGGATLASDVDVVLAYDDEWAEYLSRLSSSQIQDLASDGYFPCVALPPDYRPFNTSLDWPKIIHFYKRDRTAHDWTHRGQDYTLVWTF